jgi:methionine-rich copper-binding protein CopC
MKTTLRTPRPLIALLAATAATALLAGTALAHPGTEADHGGSSCIVTVEPGTITVGQQFTVEGTFGGASIFIVPGEDATIGEDAQADATTPQGSSFSVTFTSLGEGTYTVWGLIEGSECGDSDTLVVQGLPDTALPASSGTDASLALLVILLVAPVVVAVPLIAQIHSRLRRDDAIR